MGRKRRAASLSLLHLPCAFLAQLLSGQYLDGPSKVAAFSSCRKLRDMMLQHSACTRLHVRLLALPLSRALSAVKLASKHSSNISLHLGSTWKELCEDAEGFEHAPVMEVVSDAVWLFLGAGKKLGIMSSVTHLELKKLVMGTLLPPAIAEACPNLRGLSLDRCTINWDNTSSFAAQLPQLQSLQLDYVDTSVALGPQQPQLQQQLASLTAFQTLSMTVSDESFESCNVIAVAVASHLTHLCAWYDMGSDDAFFRQPQWAQISTALQHLHLPNATIQDTELRLFLSMPALTHLSVCSIKVDDSYVGQPCRWREVAIANVYVPALARLPLHSNLLIKAGGALLLGSSVADVKAAVVNVTRSGGLCWGTGLLSVSIVGVEDVLAGQLWSEALPLMKDIEGFRFRPWYRLSYPVLQALRDYAPW